MNKQEKIFLLKIILLAEMDASVFSYLGKNLDTLIQIEAGKLADFPPEYIKKYESPSSKSGPTSDERIKLNKILQLIRMPPKTSDLQKEPIYFFSIVGRIEEEIPESQQFDALAGDNPTEALNFISDFEWDLENRLKSLSATVSQGIEKFKSGKIPENDDEVQLIKLRKIITTMNLIFEKYFQQDLYQDTIQSLGEVYFTQFLSLNDKIHTLISDDMKKSFFDTALVLADDNFWSNILSLPSFDDLSKLDAFISILDSSRIISASTNAFLTKSVELLNSYPTAIDVVEKYGLLRIEGTTAEQEKLAQYYSTDGDASSKEKIFNLIKEDYVDESAKLIIIDDILAKRDYVTFIKVLAIEGMFKPLITNRFDEVRNFILQEADLNDANCRNLIVEFLSPQNIERFRLIDREFSVNLGVKIATSVLDNTVQKSYLETFKKLLPIYRTNGSTENYVATLLAIRDGVDRYTKSSITKFIKREGLEVKENV